MIGAAIIMHKSYDKFDRKNLIPFIKTLVLNSEMFKRTSDVSSYILALDAAWGSGKTFFVDLIVEDFSSEDKINTIKYNAWNNDFWDNPLEPLMQTIIESEALSLHESDTTASSLLSNVFTAGIELAKGFCFKKATDTFGDKAVANAEELMTKSVVNFVNGKTVMFPEYKKYCDSIQNFKCYLEDYLQKLHPDKKLLIIIDELDRCKPLFAIQTLEIAKHFFDIPNIVFFFSIDIEQLSHSIKHVYGDGMNSTGYLCRFFDYIVKLPSANNPHYVEDYIKPFINEKELYENTNYKGKEFLNVFINEIFSRFYFSLRECNTFLQSYKIMCFVFLNQYNCLEAHMLYIYLLAMKLKFPNIFNDVFILEKTSSFEGVPLFQNPLWCNIFKCVTDNIIKNKTLEEMTGSLICARGYEVDPVAVKYLRQENDTYYFKYASYMPTISGLDCKKSSVNSLNYILYHPEFESWDEIKAKNIKHFLHQKLEMFSFEV